MEGEKSALVEPRTGEKSSWLRDLEECRSVCLPRRPSFPTVQSGCHTSDVVVQCVCFEDLRKMQDDYKGTCKAKTREKLEPATRVVRLGQRI